MFISQLNALKSADPEIRSVVDQTLASITRNCLRLYISTDSDSREQQLLQLCQDCFRLLPIANVEGVLSWLFETKEPQSCFLAFSLLVTRLQKVKGSDRAALTGSVQICLQAMTALLQSAPTTAAIQEVSRTVNSICKSLQQDEQAQLQMLFETALQISGSSSEEPAYLALLDLLTTIQPILGPRSIPKVDQLVGVALQIAAAAASGEKPSISCKAKF